MNGGLSKPSEEFLFTQSSAEKEITSQCNPSQHCGTSGLVHVRAQNISIHARDGVDDEPDPGGYDLSQDHP